MSAGHARLSASSAARWLHCPGSTGSGEPSAYAAQGTFAHHIAAECLNSFASPVIPVNWLGNTTIVDGFAVECDQEMVDGVNLHRDAVLEDFQIGDMTWTEMPLLAALQRVDPDMGGTADFVRYRPSTKHLKVTDFKYGAGTYVEADDNDQLKIYALGAMLACGQVIHEVEVCIVQPRYEGAAPIRSWTFKAVEILEFIARIKEAADKTRDPFAPLVAGPHCKHFCPHQRTCPELEKHQHAITATQFSAAVPYDVAKLAAALETIPLVKARIKAIEEFAYSEATKGSAIPGWKLVEKEARRKWKNEEDVRQWGELASIDVFTSPELLSPAQLEKKLMADAPKGQKKEAGKVLDQFTHKVSSGTVLVPVSDNRPVADIKRIGASDFAATDGAAKALPLAV